MKEISHNWHIPYYRMPSSGTVIPPWVNNNLISFCLCRMHNLIPVLQSASLVLMHAPSFHIPAFFHITLPKLVPESSQMHRTSQHP